jgi:ribosomal protein S18 acetylase RimI-like enzyme
VRSDLRQVAAIEAHCVKAWPPAFVEHTDDGWVLRATPGLPGRGRSNHALPPVRAIDPSEYDVALDRALGFAAGHGVEGGLQISPTDLHAPLIDWVQDRGWSLGQDVLVMAADTQAVAACAHSDGPRGGRRGDGDFLELVVEDGATPDWVAAWAHCDRRPDIEDHLAHVFPRMAGIAKFVHDGTRAVGISVELDGIVGLFCLAVDPDLRRQGLGKALVRSMLAQHSAPLTYLQVFSRNTAGVALYRSLGFAEIYRYRHALAPGVH